MSKKNYSNQELINLDQTKLIDFLNFNKKSLFSLRMQRSLGELKDFSSFSKIKKIVARINTELVRRKMFVGEK